MPDIEIKISKILKETVSLDYYLKSFDNSEMKKQNVVIINIISEICHRIMHSVNTEKLIKAARHTT